MADHIEVLLFGQSVSYWRTATLPAQQLAMGALAETFLAVSPQQAFASSQQSLPRSQQACVPVQQALSLLQHANPLSQQPNLTGAAQQARLALQHANFCSQQLFFAGSVANALAEIMLPMPKSTTAADL